MVRVIGVLIRGTAAQSAEMPIAGSRVKGKVMRYRVRLKGGPQVW